VRLLIAIAILCSVGCATQATRTDLPDRIRKAEEVLAQCPDTGSVRYADTYHILSKKKEREFFIVDSRYRKGTVTKAEFDEFMRLFEYEVVRFESAARECR